ncbi:methylaspartate mutase subunit E [Gandjariella thermophila]|uniref:B12-binding domain-containing protein n=1 Tax=Gandjariella thermophila TaxID=1931992 RepID=A0A4D4JAH1_9PSEU|nr:methylaspartate mutase subunit E [Gandjariella thermophila]GDY33815.1 hypothetical protein GTS_54480 [Gandjariella thermophila]
MRRNDRTVVLGGIGGDSHSVGLIILHHALIRAGFRVRYLSTQNRLADLCRAAEGADAVLVSNMDGHARYYLADLAATRAVYGGQGATWYLGGNPGLDDTEDTERELRALGVDRVFLHHLEPSEVVDVLDADLGTTAGETGVRAAAGSRAAPMPYLPEPAHDFDRERADVLDQWVTGRAARDLDRNAIALAEGTQLSQLQRQARPEGRTLIHPRTGIADLAGQVQLFRELRNAGADVLSFQIDSLTRNNAYNQIDVLLKEAAARPSEFAGLNGFPLVNHGVAPVREIVTEFSGTPLQVRHSTRDPRLLAEISFAAGISAYEGGALSYNLPYYRDYSPHESVRRWRYVDRLAGRYWDRYGITIDREFFGVLTAAMVPPCLAIAVGVLEALLAAECGVRSVSLGYAEQGCRAQDIAAIRAARLLARRYLERFGHHEVDVHTVFNQYMGAFPEDHERARELLAGSAVTAALAGATRLMLKTAVEATRIPSVADNAAAMRLVRTAMAGAASTAYDAERVAEEQELILAEVTSIVDATLALPGNLGDRVAAAVEHGFIDVPFSPSLWNAGTAIALRDATGAVRFAVPGAIPLPQWVREFHRNAIARRMRDEHVDLACLVERDVLAIARCDHPTWPLDGH